ncbi:MAG: hypothetical protein CL544_11495 [Alcanivorax sp.]|nr:hypothetical protein [Alcanivorax sp.]|tara:strand:- start:821 stop:1294 length:474 start_codon:yes stop_codon:yes gene_type:complete
MALNRQKVKGRRESGSFALIPHVVMESEDFRSLSGSALKVLMCLLHQYRGKNNGDLSIPYPLAKEWGVGSKTTLSKAITELLTADLIVRTREGRFLKPGGCCALYAITWKAIDECDGKLEVAETATPPRKFTLGTTTKNPVQKVYRQGTESVPMRSN